MQAVEVNADVSYAIIERLTAGRKRVVSRIRQEDLTERQRLKEELRPIEERLA